MDEIGALWEWARSSLTFGSIGVWTLVVMAAGAWWKGLPAVLDAWSRRADQEKQHADREFSRMQGLIDAAEKRHGECEARVTALRNDYETRMARSDRRFDELRAKLDEAMAEVAGLRAQNSQIQLSLAEQIHRAANQDHEGIAALSLSIDQAVARSRAHRGGRS